MAVPLPALVAGGVRHMRFARSIEDLYPPLGTRSKSNHVLYHRRMMEPFFSFDVQKNVTAKNDIVYACLDSCQSLIYFNDGKGNFTRRKPWGPPPHSSTRALALADFNGDGHLDIAACHETLGCFVYLNDGKGHFGPGILFETNRGLP